MKLSWLSTSEAHTNNTNIYMIWQYDAMLKVIERERVRDNESIANTSNLFRGSSHCSTSPPSHRRISTISSTQDFPHREPPLRIWVNTTGSTQLLSQLQTPPLHLEARHKATQTPPLHLEARHKATQTPPHTRGVGT